MSSFVHVKLDVDVALFLKLKGSLEVILFSKIPLHFEVAFKTFFL